MIEFITLVPDSKTAFVKHTTYENVSMMSFPSLGEFIILVVASCFDRLNFGLFPDNVI